MKHWWKRNEGVIQGDGVRGGYTKNQIEDITGKIPLLLGYCVVKDENDQPFSINLGTAFFKEIYEQAKKFERQIKLRCKERGDLETYTMLLLPYDVADFFLDTTNI